MRKKYCDEESVFEHIWKNADADGLWEGDDARLAVEFSVGEDEAHEMLGELCDRNLIQRVGTATYIITRWRERDDAGKEDVTC